MFAHNPMLNPYFNNMSYQQQPSNPLDFTYYPPQQQAISQPIPNGGVTSVLDYDLDQMVKFISWVTFGLFKRNIDPSFKFLSLVNSVLSATRLPKSSLLLSINYISNKIDCDELNNINVSYNEDQIFKNLIISLILSNKFNDDKTFRNKSWSDATNLPLQEINQLEREWLSNLDYKLFKIDSFSMVESCWNTWCSKNVISTSNTNLTTNDYMSSFPTQTNISYTSTPSSPVTPTYSYHHHQTSSMSTIPNQIFENPFSKTISSPDYYGFNQSQNFGYDDATFSNGLNSVANDHQYYQTNNSSFAMDYGYNSMPYNMAMDYQNSNNNNMINHMSSINNNFSININPSLTYNTSNYYTNNNNNNNTNSYNNYNSNSYGFDFGYNNNNTFNSCNSSYQQSLNYDCNYDYGTAC